MNNTDTLKEKCMYCVYEWLSHKNDERLATQLLIIFHKEAMGVIGEEPAPHEDYGAGGRSLRKQQLERLDKLIGGKDE